MRERKQKGCVIKLATYSQENTAKWPGHTGNISREAEGVGGGESPQLGATS